MPDTQEARVFYSRTLLRETSRFFPPSRQSISLLSCARRSSQSRRFLLDPFLKRSRSIYSIAMKIRHLLVGVALLVGLRISAGPSHVLVIDAADTDTVVPCVDTLKNLEPGACRAAC